MNRLRDDVGEDPVAERGIAMLRAISPLPPMAELKRRVWSGIQRTRLNTRGARPLWSLRTFAAVGVLLCVAGTAGAVIAQRWIVAERSRSLALSQAQTEHTKNVGSRGRTIQRGMAVAAPSTNRSGQFADQLVNPSATPPTSPSTSSPLTIGSRSRAASAKPGARRTTSLDRDFSRQAGTARAGGSREPSLSRARTRVDANVAASVEADVAANAAASVGDSPVDARTVIAPAAAVASVTERTEVLDAMVALRRDRDPVRAGLLLDRYLAAHPRGVLRQEALALAMEAAAARGDAGTARRLSRLYRADYPGGRFEQFARDLVKANSGQ